MTHVRTEAAEDAERTLADAWGAQPLPVDPIEIARQFGIRVAEVRFERDISGALVKEPGRDPAILLNKRDAPNRKRFTCAHELGHYVHRSKQLDKPDEDYSYVDMRNSLSAKGIDAEEIYANEFAACLLMPEDQVREYKQEGLQPQQMALRFGVSQDAMAFRMLNLNVQ